MSIFHLNPTFYVLFPITCFTFTSISPFIRTMLVLQSFRSIPFDFSSSFFFVVAIVLFFIFNLLFSLSINIIDISCLFPLFLNFMDSHLISFQFASFFFLFSSMPVKITIEHNRKIICMLGILFLLLLFLLLLCSLYYWLCFVEFISILGWGHSQKKKKENR